MSWKQFLKPNRRKIILVCFIFLFTIFLRGIVIKVEIKSLELMEKILSPHYLLYVTIETWRTPWGTPLPFISLSPILGVILYYLLVISSFVIGLFYWYLIACLITFIYEKLKRRK